MPRALRNRKIAKSPPPINSDPGYNSALRCSEDNRLFSNQNIESVIASLDNESDQDIDTDLHSNPNKFLTTPHHSTDIFHCCNISAHEDKHHNVCSICATLASTHLRQTPNALLNGGPLSTPAGQRFFPLCNTCKLAARASGNQGCICNCLGQALCFQCKRNHIETAAAKRDAEVERRLGFANCGEKETSADRKEFGYAFMRPILKCVCGSEDIEGGEDKGGESVLRCAGCEGTVIKTGGRVWDPLKNAFVAFV